MKKLFLLFFFALSGLLSLNAAVIFECTSFHSDADYSNTQDLFDAGFSGSGGDISYAQWGGIFGMQLGSTQPQTVWAIYTPSSLPAGQYSVEAIINVRNSAPIGIVAWNNQDAGDIGSTITAITPTDVTGDLGTYSATITIEAGTSAIAIGRNNGYGTWIRALKITSLGGGGSEAGDAITYYNVGTKNSVYNPATYDGTSDITLESPSDSTGYAFSGWFSDEAFNDTINTPALAIGSEGDTAFYAKWQMIPAYTVTYNANGGVDGSTISESVIENENPIIEANPTYEGFTLEGWNTQANGEGTAFTTSSIITENITVYAVWEAEKPSLKVDFGSSQGSEAGYYIYDALDETGVAESSTILASYVDSIYAAFETNVTFSISFSSGVERPAFRGAGDDLAEKNALAADLCGINKGSADSIYLNLSGLPAGTYELTTYHHGPWCGSWGTLIDINIDNGTTVVSLDDVAHSGNNSAEVSTGTLSFDADGVAPVVIAVSNAAEAASWTLISGFDLVQTVRNQGSATGLSSVTNDNFILYPNPTNDVINIKGLEEGISISLYNTAGIKVKSTMNRMVDVSDLSQGIYYVKAGHTVKSFVKQ